MIAHVQGAQKVKKAVHMYCTCVHVPPSLPPSLTCTPSSFEQVLRHVATEVLQQSNLLVEGLREGAEGVELLREVPVDDLQGPGVCRGGAGNQARCARAMLHHADGEG